MSSEAHTLLSPTAAPAREGENGPVAVAEEGLAPMLRAAAGEGVAAGEDPTVPPLVPPVEALTVPVAEGLAPLLSELVGVPLAEPVPVPVAEPVGVRLVLGVDSAEAVTEGEAPRDREGVADAESVGLLEGVGEPVLVPVPVGEPVDEGVSEAVGDCVWAPLLLIELLPLLLGDAPFERVGVGEAD